jgi:anti-anti-sigma regulatory factor
MAMTAAINICNVERRANIVVLTPRVNLRELDYDDFEAAIAPTLRMLESGSVRHVVIDFGHSDYFGSHTITSLLKLGKKTRNAGGRMAFARMSLHEREILEATALDTFWPVYSSREEATEAVRTLRTR